MERHIIPAQSIERDDIVLTANAEDPAIIYADRVRSTYSDTGWSANGGFVVAMTDTDSFRFIFDQQITVLRGI